MRQTRPVFSSLVLAVSMIACASGGTSSSGGASADVTTPRLQGVFGGAFAGEVSIAPSDRQGEFQVALTLRGSNAGMQHPWHVHTGRCDAEGPIVGSLLAYPVIEARGDGNADLTRKIGVSLAPGRSYYVDVHRSRANDGVVACADLVPSP